jgi:hypothetical protein
MSDDRKYRQRGYQDTGEGGGEGRREGSSQPAGPRPKPDGPRGRGLGAPTETVFRCAACGEKLDLALLIPAGASELPADAACTRCGADLHSCSNCVNFDTGSRWECRRFAEIPRRVDKKTKRNDCPLWTPKAVQEFGRDRDRPEPASPKDPGGARAAFDALFKR